MRKFLLITMLLIALSTGLVHAQDACSFVFDEGTLEYITCTDYLDAQWQIPQEDARAALILVRVNNIMTTLETNSDDNVWLAKIASTVDDFASELADLIAKREAFLIEAAVVEGTLQNATNIPESFIPQLIIDTAGLRSMINNWKALESDIALLQSDLRKAQEQLPPAEVQPEEQKEILVREDLQPAEVMPMDTAEAMPSEREVIVAAVEFCSDETQTEIRNACIFQTAYPAMYAITVCKEPLADANCFETSAQSLIDVVPPGLWLELIEIYDALEDPIASLAVAHCVNNPVTNATGELVPFGNCAQIEYLDFTDALEASGVSLAETEDDDTEEGEDAGGESTSTDTAEQPSGGTVSAQNTPLVGEWHTDPIEVTCQDGSTLSLPPFTMYTEFAILDPDSLSVVVDDGEMPQDLAFHRSDTEPERFISFNGQLGFPGSFKILAPDRMVWEVDYFGCDLSLEVVWASE